MRVVREPKELEEAEEAAAREAKAAFGDETLYRERYLERPRHVEVQLLADEHGNVVALGERDCSVQRRHQKVLEESPAARLDPKLRGALSEAAVAFGRAIGYRSAGTVEFVVDGDAFYFLELNGRIQVEHPVTEAVTGLDLIGEQLRIADGERLVAQSHEVDGHAVEVRL
jgi:acetyl/propionyl-CoA carboxylase alpha subunit